MFAPDYDEGLHGDGDRQPTVARMHGRAVHVSSTDAPADITA